MRIASIIPTPDIQCVEPTLVLDLMIAFPRGQRLPLDVAVQIHTEDKKLLGVARPTSMGGQDKLPLDAPEFGSGNNEFSVPARVVLGLSPKQVDYIEGLRSKHRKGDVVLTCQIEVPFLASRMVLAGLQPVESKAGDALNAAKMVAYKQYNSREPFYSQVTNMWVLSADGGRTFLERETLRCTMPVTISSGDWLHDYASPWRTTQYMVVELPQPEILTSTPNIEQRVNTAIEAAKNASRNLAKGDWNDVLEDLRPVWELLRNDADIAGLLQRDGYPPDAITSFNDSVKAQFNLASKFVHRLDRSGTRIAPEIRASKEDAFVCYSFAMSLLNLVARKATRLS